MNINRVAEGLTVVTIGVILLANTTGYLPWGVWLTVVSLWPLLIISVGIEVLGKSVGSEWLRALSSFVVIGGLIAGAFILPDAGLRWIPGLDVVTGESATYEFDAAHDPDVELGTARITSGAGEIVVTDGRDLAAASIETALDEPRFETLIDGDVAEVDVTAGRGSSRGAAEMEVSLDDDVSWEIEIDAGATQVEADLSDLWVTSLLVSTGVSDLELSLGDRADHLFVTVRTGVSRVLIRVPEGVATQITSRVGLGGHRIDDAFERADDGDGRVWRTDGFDEDDRFIKIDLEVGISDVEVVTY